MVPNSLAGLLIFIVMLAPGLAYVLRHERVVPARSYTAFRETLRVVYVSVVCLVITALAFAGLRWRLPNRTPDIHALVVDPDKYAREHYVELAWWAFGLILFATLVGAGAADKRVVAMWKRVTGWRATRWIIGKPSIGHTSAWYTAFHLRDREPGRTWLGVQMDDGSYMEGELFSFNVAADEDENRELVLMRPHVTKGDHVRLPMLQDLTILSARHIVRIDVTRIAPARPPVPSQPERVQADVDEVASAQPTSES